KDNNNGAGYLFELFDCYIEQANYDKAHELLNELDPDVLSPEEKITRCLKYSALFHARREFETAIQHMLAAEKMSPGDQSIKMNLALMHKNLGEYVSALSWLEKLLDLNERHTGALELSGIILTIMGKPRLARTTLDKALAASDTQRQASIRFNRALANLSGGDFRTGWKEYEYRKNRLNIRDCLEIPEWQGADKDHESLLIVGEQGVGDMIMFASCLGDMLNTVKQCSLIVDSRLVPVFKSTFPPLRLIGIENTEELLLGDNSYRLKDNINAGDFAAFIALGSLPLHFRECEEDFPREPGYLCIDELKRKTWQQKLAGLNNGPRIGISWKGGKDEETRRLRSVTPEDLVTVFDGLGATIVNLQHLADANDLAVFNNRPGIRFVDFEEIDPIKNLEDFMALISGLDLVITIDNSTAHISGALGVETWTLLSGCPDWRWMNGRSDTPWYPAMRLFRQSDPGQWQPVLDHVRSELSAKRGNTA
ncbi:MAG: hypothetical protein MI673_06600, partial [Thiotrichales bacterium]|nr:hypothetical protein [Thiotrichales bacterium]